MVNLFGIIPYAGINLALYETLKDAYLLRMIEIKKRKLKRTNDTNNKTQNSDTQLDVKRPPAFILLSIGTFSSSCGQIAVYPLALVRTKLQVLDYCTLSHIGIIILQFNLLRSTKIKRTFVIGSSWNGQYWVACSCGTNTCNRIDETHCSDGRLFGTLPWNYLKLLQVRSYLELIYLRVFCNNILYNH